MVSRNNQWYKLQQGMEQVPHFGIRKLTVGVSSVLLGLSFMGINMTTVHADTATPAMTSASQVAAQGTTTTANTGEKANPETAQSTDENNAAMTSLNVAGKAGSTMGLSQQATSEPAATEVNLGIRADSGDKTGDWYPPNSTLYNGSFSRFGVEGSFVIPKNEIKGNNRIKLMTIDQTSDTGWLSSIYFEWLPDVVVNGQKIGTLVSDGNTDNVTNGYHQMKSATLYLKLVSDVSKFNQSDLYVSLNVSHAGVFNYRSDLLPLAKLPNHESTSTYTVANGAQAGKTIKVHYVLNQTSRDMTADEAGNVFHTYAPGGVSMDSTGTTLFRPTSNSTTLNPTEIQQFVNSIGQDYHISVDNKLPVVAVNFKNSASGMRYVDGDGFWTQGTSIPFYGSDGKLQTIFLDGADISTIFHRPYVKDFGSNVSIKELLAANFQGMALSKQADGSLNMVLRANSGDFKVDDNALGINPDGSIREGSLAFNWLHHNTVVAMDSNPEQAIRNTVNHFKQAGSILPTAAMCAGIGQDNPSVGGQTTTTYYDENGNFTRRYVNNDASKKFTMEGQTEIHVHYINGLTGQEIQPATSHVGWPAGNSKGHSADHYVVATQGNIPGYAYRTNDNTQKLDDSRSDDQNASAMGSVSKDGHTVLVNGQAVTLDFPAQGVQDYDFILDPTPQKITVNYVDSKTGKTLECKTLNGYSDQKANYNSKDTIAKYEKLGYKLVSDGTNGENPVFDENDDNDQVYTVTFDHNIITVSPDKPQNSGTTIPGTNQTFPQGVAKDDLNKDVTRTITVESTPHSKEQSITQTVHLTRTATVDAVTGSVDYGNGWSTGNWDQYTVPTVPGYTPSQSTVTGKTVDYTTPNAEVTITYTPNNYTGKVSYIDDQGHEQSATALAGHTDQTIDIDTDNVPAGWVKEEGQNLPKKMTITDQGIATVYVHIKHGKVIVNPDQPKTPQDKLPDNPSQGYPTGVDSDSLNKTITRTIEVLDPHIGKTITTQTVHLTRQATVDEVTGQVSYGDWTTGEWDEFAVPAVAGYTPSKSKVASQTVTAQTNDTTVTITYTANDQRANIVYRDKDGNTIKTDTVNGKTDQTVKTNSTVPAGWEVVAGEKPAPSEITFTGDHTPDTIVTVQHKHDIVNPGDDQPTGPLPGDKDRDYPQLEELAKNVHFTVRITDPRTGEVTTKAQEVDYVRQADIDEVTGDVTYSDWKPAAAEASVDTDAPQSQSFADVVVPIIQGYTAHSRRSHAASEVRSFVAQADQIDSEPADTGLAVNPDGSVKVKGDSNVTAGTPDRLVEVTYTANPQSGKIIYVDSNGNPIAETPIQGVTDQTIPFTPQIPAGYELVPGQTIPTEITFNGDGQPVVVKVEIEKIPTRNNRGGNGQANGGYYNGARLENGGSQTNVNTAGQYQANDQQLPQTGDENSSALVGLGLMGITLGMFGLRKKEDN